MTKARHENDHKSNEHKKDDSKNDNDNSSNNSSVRIKLNERKNGNLTTEYELTISMHSKRIM